MTHEEGQLGASAENTSERERVASRDVDAPNFSIPSVVALVIAGALITTGLWGEIADKLNGIWTNSLFVSGLALIFYVFGTQATVKYRHWVMAGVGGTALIFLFAVTYLRQDSYAQLAIGSSKEPELSLQFGRSIVRGEISLEGSQKFTRMIVFNSEMGTADQFRLHVDYVSSSTTQRSPNSESATICFDRAKISPWFARNKSVTWMVDVAKRQLIDLKREVVGSSQDCMLSIQESRSLPAILDVHSPCHHPPHH
jgi:hypothetical protein